MNKEQFITSLRKELRKLPPEEVVAATEYYEEYFAEAVPAEGEDAAAVEARLIEELGSPKSIAAQIKSEYASRVLTEDETTMERKPTVSKISAAWWVLLGVLAAPIGIPLAIVLGAVIFALLIALFAVIISLFAGVIGILAGGIGAVVFGIISLATVFSTGLLFLGTGLFLVALAVLVGIALIMLVKVLVRAPGRLAKRSKKNGGADHE